MILCYYVDIISRMLSGGVEIPKSVPVLRRERLHSKPHAHDPLLRHSLLRRG